MWRPSVYTNEDGDQVLVNVEDGRITHVATRSLAERTWGPPLECIVDGSIDLQYAMTPVICTRCHERPIISTRHQMCATCIVNGLRTDTPGYADQMEEARYEAFVTGETP